MDRKLLAILTAIFTLTLGLLSCSSGSGVPDEPEPDPEQTLVTLVLDLSVNPGMNGESHPSHAAAPASRASDGVDFELPESDYEKVKEMRIIITRPGEANIVEHNFYTHYDQVTETFGVNQFKVEGGEIKSIYIIANESGLPADIEDELEGIDPGTPLTVDLPSLMLNVESGKPYINNSGVTKKYIPMTESYEIFVPLAQTITDEVIKTDENGTFYSSEKYFRISTPLFVTRTTTKFSFAVERGETSTLSKGMQIKSITFSGKIPATGLGTQEYLFPKHAIYSPEKYTASTEKHNGREIVSFAVPQTAGTFSYTFTPDNFGLNKAADSADGLTGLSATYVPLDYFLESGLKEFTISITTVTDGDIEYVWEPATLTNLPRLPRNTHVAVLFTLTDKTLQAVVKLVPYIGVKIEYTFGFNKLVDWDRIHNDDVEDV